MTNFFRRCEENRVRTWCDGFWNDGIASRNSPVDEDLSRCGARIVRRYLFDDGMVKQVSVSDRCFRTDHILVHNIWRWIDGVIEFWVDLQSPPNGKNAVRIMPSRLAYSSTSFWSKYGCSSIWFTAGLIPVTAMTFLRLSIVKLDTPIFLT